MLRAKVALSALALCIGAAAPALAQDSLEKLQQMKITGYGMKSR